MRRLSWSGVLVLGVMWSLSSGCAGCGDDVNPVDEPVNDCPAGEEENPITGRCQPTRVNPTPGGPDSGRDLGDLDLDAGVEDMGDMGDMTPDEDMRRPPPLDMEPVEVDIAPSMRCARGIDSDGDGLDNDCECLLGTDPSNSDTDGDGLPDGYEDANQNCRVDPGETQPTVADTDSDGLSDGLEVREGLDPLNFDTDGDGIRDGIEYNSCLDPLNVDTDGDGIDDGIEDANKDGELGICPNRMYDPVCAQGESDPCKVDTNGDGRSDGESVSYLGCRPEFLQAIPTPQLIRDQAEDFQLAIPRAATTAPVTGVAAHAFNHEQASYAGFVTSVTVPSGDVEATRDLMLVRLRSRFPGASFINTGRRVVTHDGFDGLVSVKINLGAAGRADEGRDQALSGLLSVGSVNHGLSGTFSTSINNMTLVMSVVRRTGSKAIITGAVASGAVYDSRMLDTGFLMDDVTGVGSVALHDALLEDACVAYEVNDKPQVDFIWVVDGSGSMSDENNNVRNYASNFAQILSASNLDWRLGVVSSNCSDIANDPAISAEVKGLFGSNGCPDPLAGLPNFPGLPTFSPYRLKNGMLCDKNNAFFTTNPQLFADCVSEVGSPPGIAILTEHTVTVATAAIHRALPRAENSPTKLRPNAATVVISVTDEFDDHFEQRMGWRDGGNSGAQPNDLSSGIDYVQLDSVVKPFVDYFNKSDVGATVFGIIWVPGQACATASEAAAGIERVVNRTGGTSGNICSGNLNTTLAAIATASAGLASGLRIEGVPIPDTMTTRVGSVATQMITEPTRSREQGWDYDAVTNAINFFGASLPQTRDRVVVTYKRWENSVQMCVADSDCAGGGLQKVRCRDGKCI